MIRPDLDDLAQMSEDALRLIDMKSETTIKQYQVAPIVFWLGPQGAESSEWVSSVSKPRQFSVSVISLWFAHETRGQA